MRAARCPIQDAAELDPSIMLWSILKYHEVMDDYLRHEFRKHPAINSILVQKMLRTSLSSALHFTVSALETRHATLVTTVNNLKSQVATLESAGGQKKPKAPKKGKDKDRDPNGDGQ